MFAYLSLLQIIAGTPFWDEYPTESSENNQQNLITASIFDLWKSHDHGHLQD